jgi:hypothetical protein
MYATKASNNGPIGSLLRIDEVQLLQSHERPCKQLAPAGSSRSSISHAESPWSPPKLLTYELYILRLIALAEFSVVTFSCDFAHSV